MLQESDPAGEMLGGQAQALEAGRTSLLRPFSSQPVRDPENIDTNSNRGLLHRGFGESSVAAVPHPVRLNPPRHQAFDSRTSVIACLPLGCALLCSSRFKRFILSLRLKEQAAWVAPFRMRAQGA